MQLSRTQKQLASEQQQVQQANQRLSVLMQDRNKLELQLGIQQKQRAQTEQAITAEIKSLEAQTQQLSGTNANDSQFNELLAQLAKAKAKKLSQEQTVKALEQQISRQNIKVEEKCHAYRFQ